MKSAVVLESLKVALATFLGASYASQGGSPNSPDVDRLTRGLQGVKLSETPKADPVPAFNSSGRIERFPNGESPPAAALGASSVWFDCKDLEKILGNNGSPGTLSRDNANHVFKYCPLDTFRKLYDVTGYLPDPPTLADLYKDPNKEGALRFAVERGASLTPETFEEELREALATGHYETLRAAAKRRQLSKEPSGVCLDCSIYYKLWIHSVNMKLSQGEFDHLFLNCNLSEFRDAKFVSDATPSDKAVIEVIRKNPADPKLDLVFKFTDPKKITSDVLRAYSEAIRGRPEYDNIPSYKLPDIGLLHMKKRYYEDPVGVINVLTETGHLNWVLATIRYAHTETGEPVPILRSTQRVEELDPRCATWSGMTRPRCFRGPRYHDSWQDVCPTQESLDIGFQNGHYLDAWWISQRCKMGVSQYLIDEALSDPENELNRDFWTLKKGNRLCPSLEVARRAWPYLDCKTQMEYCRRCRDGCGIFGTLNIGSRE